MSRWTLGNVLKVGLAVFFLPLVAYLVLFIGAVKKNVRAILEGLLYAAGFSVAVLELGWGGPGILLGLASMGASGVRAWHLRDLWLPKRRRPWARFLGGEEVEAAPPPSAAALEGPEGRTTALDWLAAHTRQHRHRLPAQAYTSVLETCRVLDAVVEAERHQPSGDARLEYELDAIVKQYLPAVVTGYLAVPPEKVDEKQPGGRTPNEELTEQLRLLSGQAEYLRAGHHSRATAQLTTSGNFLREKFGHLEQKDAFGFGVK